jgi:hypothetical protein
MVSVSRALRIVRDTSSPTFTSSAPYVIDTRALGASQHITMLHGVVGGFSRPQLAELRDALTIALEYFEKDED